MSSLPDRAGTRTVFISSTAEDLKPYRAAARDAANGAELLPKMMEYFVAGSAKPPLPACLDKVSEAGVVVVIVAHRYGWVPPDQEPGARKSITRLECERAAAEGKEVLAFLVDDKVSWPEEQREEHEITVAVREGRATPELLATVQDNVKRLKEFKAWLGSRGFRASFVSPEDLRGRASDALHDWLRRQEPTVDTAGIRRMEDNPLQPKQRWMPWLPWTLVGVFLSGVLGVIFGGQDIRWIPILLALATLFAIPEFAPSKPTRRVAQAGTVILCLSAVVALSIVQPTPAPKVDAYVAIKIVGAEQFLFDDKAGVYVVMPDVHLTNRGDTGAIANVELLVETAPGASVHFEASPSRIPEIEGWLTKNDMGNPGFLGRQINVPPKTGVSGYMAFYADRTRLQMASILPRELPSRRLSFLLDQSGQKPRTISYGQALTGKD